MAAGGKVAESFQKQKENKKSSAGREGTTVLPVRLLRFRLGVHRAFS
jgi:hypothetical protein